MNYKLEDDTIAAISTALSPAGIGIIRVSGPDAIRIVDRIFEFAYHSKKNSAEEETVLKSGAEEDSALKKDVEKDSDLKSGEEKDSDLKSGEEKESDLKSSAEKKRVKKALSDVKSHTIHYGRIVQGGVSYDEVLVSVMRAPNTYTREDIVEINCHGGPFVCQKVLKLVLGAGARCAEPGEFTKRAFLNGRMKLTEAEAVMDVISAENDYALQNGVAQLSGSVQKEIRRLRKEILDEIAYIEAALDDPEHMSLEGYAEELAEKTEKLLGQMEKLIRQADKGRIMKEGVKTAIVGRPNVGKSSLLNAMLGENRAIVTEIAGTTRDTLEENIYFHGITLHLIDTAGIRRTEDTVEKIGVERAVEAVKQADLVLFVVDGSESLTQEDLEIWDLVKEKKTILVRNKLDLGKNSEKKYESGAFSDKKNKELSDDSSEKNKELSDNSGEKNKELSDDSGEKNKELSDDLDEKKKELSDDSGEKNKELSDNSVEKNKKNSDEKSKRICLSTDDMVCEKTGDSMNYIEQGIFTTCKKKEIPVIEISAKTLEGMDELEAQVEKMFYMEEIQPNTQVYITNARQKEALLDAYKSMKLVRQSIADGMPEDFFSIDLTDAYESLGKIIGETLEDDVAEQIFSKFCMGK